MPKCSRCHVIVLPSDWTGVPNKVAGESISRKGSILILLCKTNKETVNESGHYVQTACLHVVHSVRLKQKLCM